MLFKSRIASAFPGDRGIKWYEGEKAVKRLAIFFKGHLRFQTREEKNFSFEYSPVGDPIWYFRGIGAMSIEKFTILSSSKILLGFEELKIKKIAVNVDRLYYKSYIYVEVCGEMPIGINAFTEDDISNQIETFGYASESFAILGDRVISSQESDDGAAVIDDEVVEAFDAEDRIRYLTDYNFIIAPKQSPYNSMRFQQDTEDLFNDILTKKKSVEELFSVLSKYKKFED